MKETMMNRKMIARELVKIAKYISSSRKYKAGAHFNDAGQLAEALFKFDKKGYSNFAGEMPSGKWFCVEWDREEGVESWYCYLNASVYDDLEPKGFMFDYLGTIPCGTATMADCRDIADYAFECDAAKLGEYPELDDSEFYANYLADIDGMSDEMESALKTKTREVIKEVDRIGGNINDALEKALPDLEKKWFLEYCRNSILTEYTEKEKDAINRNFGRFEDEFEENCGWREMMYRIINEILRDEGLSD